MESMLSPSNQSDESNDIYSRSHRFSLDLENLSCGSTNKACYSSMSYYRSNRFEEISKKTLMKLRRRVLSMNNLKINRKIRSISDKHECKVPMIGSSNKDSKTIKKPTKTLYESLIETELQQFTKRQMKLKESVISIINSQEGSRFLQGLLKDFPKECFRLLFIEVSFI